MKKQGIPFLVIITVAFVGFIFGFYIGRNYSSTPVTVSVPASMRTPPPETTVPEVEETIPEATISFPVNINTASLQELSALPGIGEVLAQRIIEYREEAGKFESVEDIMMVSGIGKIRFENIIDLITIGG